MSNILKISISKKYLRITQFIFILSCLFNLSNSQEYTNESMAVTPVLGLGGGTLAVIVAIAIGVVVCIFGLAFPNPGLFVFIGIVIPVVVFIFVIACPRVSDKKEVEYWNNSRKNNYIVARWFHFLVMLILFLGLFVPFFLKWNITIIPQRVDSSSQKDFYDDNYLEQIEKQKKRKYNLEETDILLPRKLPLGINRRKNNLNKNISNIQNSTSLIQDNSQNNISNNLIDNNENSQVNIRPILPSTTKRNEFNENRKKFTGFIRKKDNQ